MHIRKLKCREMKSDWPEVTLIRKWWQNLDSDPDLTVELHSCWGSVFVPGEDPRTEPDSIQ